MKFGLLWLWLLVLVDAGCASGMVAVPARVFWPALAEPAAPRIWQKPGEACGPDADLAECNTAATREVVGEVEISSAERLLLFPRIDARAEECMRERGWSLLRSAAAEPRERS